MSSIETIRSEIVDCFSQAWELNDLAHRQDHFEEVFKTGIHLNEDQHYYFDPVHILFAAYFHDMFAWSRVNHHELSFLWMRTTDHPVTRHLTASAIKMVAHACLEHRASFKGTFTSEFAELINSADRGFPDDVPAMVERSRKYWLTHNPLMSDDERMAGVIAHIKEKFGHNGYARYPDIYLKTFGDRLDAMRDEVERL